MTINLPLIRERMEELGVNTKQLSEMCPVPKSTLERILNGSTPNPTAQTMKDLALALDLNMNDLFGIENEVAHKPQHVDHHNDEKLIMLYRTMISERDQRIKKLTIAVVILVAFQMFRWTVDVSNPQLGWIRLDEANTTFVSLFLLFSFLLAGIAGIVYMYKYKNFKKE